MKMINWQMERFLRRHRMKQKIVELARKYPVSEIPSASRVYGQQQLFDCKTSKFQ